eukprot:296106_1
MVNFFSDNPAIKISCFVFIGLAVAFAFGGGYATVTSMNSKSVTVKHPSEYERLARSQSTVHKKKSVTNNSMCFPKNTTEIFVSRRNRDSAAITLRLLHAVAYMKGVGVKT